MEIKEIFMKTKVSNLLIAAALMLIAADLYAQPKLVDADSKIEYAIEWHLNGGTQNPSNTETYTAEDGLVLATPVREGYTFDGWFENADLSGSKITEIKKGETQKKIFYAGWVITKEQAIKIMKEEMVTVIPAGKKVNLENFAGTEGIQVINAYQIGKHEVTQELYMAVMGNNPSNFKNNPAPDEIQEKRPVENISWQEACDFCNKLSELMGLTPCYDKDYECNYSANGFRLPSRGEWEMAARGGVAGGWDYEYSGGDYPDNVAWNWNNSYWENEYREKGTHEVGKKNPNSLGIYDMSGNVWEWCNRYSYVDGWGYKYTNHYYCGGSYYDYGSEISVTSSGYSTYGEGWEKCGFRLACSLFN